jgi:hypothetical protein
MKVWRVPALDQAWRLLGHQKIPGIHDLKEVTVAEVVGALKCPTFITGGFVRNVLEGKAGGKAALTAADIRFAAGIADTGHNRDERAPSMKYMVHVSREKGWGHEHISKEHSILFGNSSQRFSLEGR